MTRLKLALAQVRCEKGEWEVNLRRAEELMAQASTEGCDVLVLPEMGLSGYCDPAKFPDAIQPLDSPLVQTFVDLTRRYHIAASGGFIESNPHGKPFITQVLAQGGAIVAVYRKVHVVEEEAQWFSPGADTAVFDLQVPEDVIRCALAVCADSDRPDLFADFARKGARVVLHSSAPGLYERCTDDEAWAAGYEWYKGYLAERLPVYARDNYLYIAVATQTGATADEDFPGGSFVFDPHGECLAATPDYREALLMHEIDLP